MVQTDGTLLVVDDDEAVCRSLKRLLLAAGWQVQTFVSAEQFLLAPRARSPACLVLDIELPGRTGLQLQEALRESANDIPIVFITGHGGIAEAVRAMRAGAVHFLAKPFAESDLLAALGEAFAVSDERDRRNREVTEVRRRMAALTPRQLQVMRLVVRGMLNKQIARALNIAEKTVKVHRSRVMQVMEVTSVAELVRAAVTAETDAGSAGASGAMSLSAPPL